MNHLISFLLKSVVAFLIILFQFPVFATNYYSTNDGPFDELTTWSTNQTGGRPPLSIDFRDQSNNFTIQNGDKVTINSTVAVSLNALTIVGSIRGGVSSLTFLTDVKTFVINGNLSIGNGLLDFGTASVTVAVGGNLIDGTNSAIKQSPAIGSTQRIILNGAKNAIESYIANPRGGKSEVSYASDSEQEIFATSTNAYSTLSISGIGKKTLAGNITVSTGLNLSDTYIQLDINSLEYAGTESNLQATTGWVNTNSRGVYKNINPNDATKSFPVGNASAMQKVKLSNISLPSAVIQMQFAYNATSKPRATSTGMGPWYVYSIDEFTFNATFYPGTGNSDLTPTSNVAFYNAAKLLWEMKPTDYTNNSYSNSDPLTSIAAEPTWLMLYNCPLYTITHPSQLVGYAGELYSETFSVNMNNRPLANSDITLLSISHSSFIFDDNTLGGKSTLPTLIDFTLRYSDLNKCRVDTAYTLKFINLPSPNLTMANIDAKTFDSDSFKIRTYSRSTGNITYSIASNGGCATINSTTGFVTILPCGSPPTNNQYTITATQDKSQSYKGEFVSKSFIINPAPGRLYVKNFAFLVNGPNTPIKTATKSTGAITFDQLSGFNEATVTAAMIDPQQTGQFTVHISLAATPNYTAFDSVYTFNVYTLNKPPIAVADTITLEMGKDSTFNILLNDRGQTSEIIPKHTDIDIENRGQQIKYYATELGNFTIDTLGNLTIIPFYGFIGSGRIGYTVTDLNGLSSEIAYLEVTVKPPYVVPELKVNTVMTPNGDNMNDALVIANTDLSKENSLIILDQVGNTVYETANYQNNWEGVDMKDNKLEPGVYFYTFKEKNSGRELKNYIQIVK